MSHGPDGTAASPGPGADPVDRSPARLSAGIAIGAAVLALLALPPVVALTLGAPGVALLGTGALRGTRRHVTYGTVGVLLGVTVAAILGAGPGVVVPAGLLSVVAWDVGRYGITVGEQLGRAADATAIQVTHATMTASVATAGVGVAYAAYLLVVGGRSVAVLVLALFGATVVLATLR